MAKRKSSITSPYGKREPAGAPKKVGFFGKIKEFFKNMFENIKEFFMYAAGAPGTQEGKPAGTDPVYKAYSDLMDERENFPGYKETNMDANFVVRIPPTNDELSVQDKAHYLSVLRNIHPIMPDPIKTNDASFITTITRDANKAMQKEQDGTFMYAVGRGLIISRIQDGKCTFSVSDGITESGITVDNPELLKAAFASLYTKVMAPDVDSHFYQDIRTGASYLQIKNDKNEFDTFVAETMHPHVNNYDEKEPFIIRKTTLESMVQFTGPGALSRETAAAATQLTEDLSYPDMRHMVTAMHEGMWDTTGQQVSFATKDKMFWVAKEGDNFVAHVAPLNCKYPDIPDVTRVLPPEAREWSKDGNKALFRVINGISKTLDKRIEGRDELEAKKNPQPKRDDIPKDTPISNNTDTEQNQPPQEEPPATPKQMPENLLTILPNIVEAMNAMPVDDNAMRNIQLTNGALTITLSANIIERPNENPALTTHINIVNESGQAIPVYSEEVAGDFLVQNGRCETVQEAAEWIASITGDNNTFTFVEGHDEQALISFFEERQEFLPDTNDEAIIDDDNTPGLLDDEDFNL